jgi:hypothetical protein
VEPSVCIRGLQEVEGLLPRTAFGRIAAFLARVLDDLAHAGGFRLEWYKVGSSSMAQAKILIVDDDQDIRRLLGIRLKARGYRRARSTPTSSSSTSCSRQGTATS